ncbi:hypothetical protein U3516DRAFT_273488 [Neocallimastix sp. 'constans']
MYLYFKNQINKNNINILFISNVIIIIFNDLHSFLNPFFFYLYNIFSIINFYTIQYNTLNRLKKNTDNKK